MAYFDGETSRELDDVGGVVGRGVHFVDPDGSKAFALAMQAQQTGMMQVAVGGRLLAEAEGFLLEAAGETEEVAQAGAVSGWLTRRDASLSASPTIGWTILWPR